MNKNINIISFNILNRQFSPIRMLFKKYNLNKDEMKQIVNKEIKRFNQVIGPGLVEFFKEISHDTIIFLQEVNSDFLTLIKNNFNKDLIFVNTQQDYLIQLGKKGREHKNTYDDYRVIILPEFFIDYKISSKDIQLISSNASKAGLMVMISKDDFNLVLINIHLYWKLTPNELQNIAEKIYGDINKIYLNLIKIKLIISGDFNKGEKKVENLFIKSINLNSSIKITNNYQLNDNDFTSHTTDITESKPFDVIDHILTYGILVNEKTQIINKIGSSNIFINPDQLLKTLQYSTNFSKFENISDHLIIKLKVKL